MRTAVFTAPDELDLIQTPTPAVSAGSVLVRVGVCGICGSDLAHLSGYGEFPYFPGHEFCGTVETIGRDVPERMVGERVVINPNLGCGDCPFCRKKLTNLCDRLKSRRIKSNGGLSDLVSLDSRMVYPLPDSLSSEQAVFIEPLSCALHAVKRAEPLPNSPIYVSGAGTMGTLVTMILLTRDRRVVLTEVSGVRRELAGRVFLEAGDRLDLQNFAGDTSGPPRAGQPPVGQSPAEPPDLVFECSGSGSALVQAMQWTRKAGRIVTLGLIIGKMEFPAELITRKELDLRGAWLNPDTFEEAIRFAEVNRKTLSRFNTRTFRLSEIKAAFSRAAEPDCHKVLVYP